MEQSSTVESGCINIQRDAIVFDVLNKIFSSRQEEVFYLEERIQMLFYVLQQFELISPTFFFDWNDYGVYSVDLENDVNYLISEKSIEINKITNDKSSIRFLTQARCNSGINLPEELKCIYNLDIRSLDLFTVVIHLSKDESNFDILLKKAQNLRKHFNEDFHTFNESTEDLLKKYLPSIDDKIRTNNDNQNILEHSCT